MKKHINELTDLINRKEFELEKLRSELSTMEDKASEPLEIPQSFPDFENKDEYKEKEADPIPLSQTSISAATEAMKNGSLEPVKSSEKSVINGVLINQLCPFKYSEAWMFFLRANEEAFTPTQIDFKQDGIDYRALTRDERKLVDAVLFSMGEASTSTMRLIGLSIMEPLQAPELQIYTSRVLYEKGLHAWVFNNTLKEIHDSAESINDDLNLKHRIKIKLTEKILSPLMVPDIDLTDEYNLQVFTTALIHLMIVSLGTWSFNDTAPVYFMAKSQGKMKGITEAIQFVNRDTSLQVEFGIYLINNLVKENRNAINKEMLSTMWKECLEAETSHAMLMIKDPILSDSNDAYSGMYSASKHIEQYQYRVNSLAMKIGLNKPYEDSEDQFPWIVTESKMGKKEEIKEHTSNTGSLDWG